jgi:hypothetical protein
MARSFLVASADPRGFIHVRAGGRLDAELYPAFIPRYEALVRELGAPAPMLIELDSSFSGWTPRGLMADLRFDAAHRRFFGNTALIGHKRWQRWGARLINPSTERTSGSSNRTSWMRQWTGSVEPETNQDEEMEITGPWIVP